LNGSPALRGGGCTASKRVKKKNQNLPNIFWKSV